MNRISICLLITLTTSSLLLLTVSSASLTISTTFSGYGVVQYNTTPSRFIIRAADTALNTIKPGTASYEANWASFVKDILGCNTLRFQCGGEGDVWHINMIQNPSTWAANLESLLEEVGNASLSARALNQL